MFTFGASAAGAPRRAFGSNTDGGILGTSPSVAQANANPAAAAPVNTTQNWFGGGSDRGGGVAFNSAAAATSAPPPVFGSAAVEGSNNGFGPNVAGPSVSTANAATPMNATPIFGSAPFSVRNSNSHNDYQSDTATTPARATPVLLSGTEAPAAAAAAVPLPPPAYRAATPAAGVPVFGGARGSFGTGTGGQGHGSSLHNNGRTVAGNASHVGGSVLGGGGATLRPPASVGLLNTSGNAFAPPPPSYTPAAMAAPPFSTVSPFTSTTSVLGGGNGSGSSKATGTNSNTNSSANTGVLSSPSASAFPASSALGSGTATAPTTESHHSSTGFSAKPFGGSAPPPFVKAPAAAAAVFTANASSAARTSTTGTFRVPAAPFGLGQPTVSSSADTAASSTLSPSPFTTASTVTSKPNTFPVATVVENNVSRPDNKNNASTASSSVTESSAPAPPPVAAAKSVFSSAFGGFAPPTTINVSVNGSATAASGGEEGGGASTGVSNNSSAPAPSTSSAFRSLAGGAGPNFLSSATAGATPPMPPVLSKMSAATSATPAPPPSFPPSVFASGATSAFTSAVPPADPAPVKSAFGVGVTSSLPAPSAFTSVFAPAAAANTAAPPPLTSAFHPASEQGRGRGRGRGGRGGRGGADDRRGAVSNNSQSSNDGNTGFQEEQRHREGHDRRRGRVGLEAETENHSVPEFSSATPAQKPRFEIPAPRHAPPQHPSQVFAPTPAVVRLEKVSIPTLPSDEKQWPLATRVCKSFLLQLVSSALLDGGSADRNGSRETGVAETLEQAYFGVVGREGVSGDFGKTTGEMLAVWHSYVRPMLNGSQSSSNNSSLLFPGEVWIALFALGTYLNTILSTLTTTAGGSGAATATHGTDLATYKAGLRAHPIEALTDACQYANELAELLQLLFHRGTAEADAPPYSVLPVVLRRVRSVFEEATARGVATVQSNLNAVTSKLFAVLNRRVKAMTVQSLATPALSSSADAAPRWLLTFDTAVKESLLHSFAYLVTEMIAVDAPMNDDVELFIAAFHECFPSALAERCVLYYRRACALLRQPLRMAVVQEAAELLAKAIVVYPPDAAAHNRRILQVKLLAAQLALGRLPPDPERVALDVPQLIDVVNAIKASRVDLLDVALKMHGPFFVQIGIHNVLFLARQRVALLMVVKFYLTHGCESRLCVTDMVRYHRLPYSLSEAGTVWLLPLLADKHMNGVLDHDYLILSNKAPFDAYPRELLTSGAAT